MADKVMYFGREVKALLPKENPLIVLIDVLQKESDCAEGLDLEHRMCCPRDCQNTFVTCLYSVPEERIVKVGALSKGDPSYIAQTMEKHGLSYEDAKRLIKEGSEHIRFERDSEAKNVYYKGDLLMMQPKCNFVFGDHISTASPEINQYLELIQKDPRKIMAECGIVFEKRDNIEVIMYRDERNRTDLPKVP